MKTGSIGFIGGGRITQIFLQALSKNDDFSAKIVVSDLDSQCLKKINTNFPSIETITDNKVAACQEIVIIALHPPAIPKVLNEIKDVIKDETIIISVAPKINLHFLSENLNNQKNLLRCIPNSPSIIKTGYNPITFYKYFSQSLKNKVFEVLENFGAYFETDESKLEIFALITAMGPTYFQFQIRNLYELAIEFGLDENESRLALKHMLEGMNSLLFDSDLDYEDINDLIPVKPLHNNEANILKIYNSTLRPLYKKLSSK